MSKETPVNETTIPIRMLSAGTAACVADLATFPFDVAKVRLQILGEGSAMGSAAAGTTLARGSGLFGTLLFLWKTEGLKGLYGGIVPGLQRQCVFASIRIGIYDSIKTFYADNLGLGESTSSTMAIRILSGITSGAIAISIAQPTDVVKVKMQAQGRSGDGTKYKGSLEAYRRIYKMDGAGGLWRGLMPNMVRNSVVNAAELVCYDTIKDQLIKREILKDGLFCHFTSAFGAGFVATIVASPIDVVKTRFMNSSGNKYTGVWNCASQLFHQDGFLGFYKGFTPSFMRLGTWNVCMFVTYEQLKKAFSSKSAPRPIRELEPEQLMVPIAPRGDLLKLSSQL